MESEKRTTEAQQKDLALYRRNLLQREEQLTNSERDHAANSQGLHLQTRDAEVRLAEIEKREARFDSLIHKYSKKNEKYNALDYDTYFICSINDKILSASTDEERAMLIKVREDVISQNILRDKNQIELEESRHKRTIERGNLLLKIVSSPTLISAGVWLLPKTPLVGGMIIMAGLYMIAPEFMMEYLKRNKSKSINSTKEKESD